MKNSKIVVISIPVLLIGGTEMQTLNLVKVLSDESYEVIVLCYYEYEIKMVEYMELTGAEVILMKLQRCDGLLVLATKLIAQFKELSPAIIHVQYVAPGLIPIIAARISGIRKVIATVHQPGRTYGWKAKVMLRFGARLCSLFLCVSKSVEESWFGDSELFDPDQPQLKRKHCTLYNAVDTAHIAREVASDNLCHLRTSLKLNNNKVVGYVGRLRWEKGPSVLVEAMVRVIEAVPDATLLIVGDGPDRKILENQARELKIESHIVFLGLKQQYEVFQLYGLMDVVAIPSYFEGFGLTAAEAMAASVPVIASDADGLREVIDHHKTGILVRIGDSDAMASAIIEVLISSDVSCRMGTASLQKIEDNFSILKIQRYIQSVYSCVLSM